MRLARYFFIASLICYVILVGYAAAMLADVEGIAEWMKEQREADDGEVSGREAIGIAALIILVVVYLVIYLIVTAIPLILKVVNAILANVVLGIICTVTDAFVATAHAILTVATVAGSAVSGPVPIWMIISTVLSIVSLVFTVLGTSRRRAVSKAMQEAKAANL